MDTSSAGGPYDAPPPRVAVWMVAGVGLVVVGVFALFELGAAMPLPWTVYLGGVALVGATVGLAVAARGRGGWRGPVALGAVASLLLVVLLAVPWTSRKRFLRRLDRVEVGMSREEARRVLLPYRPLPADGALTPATTDWYSHSSAAEFNADFGIVRYRDGRVTAVEFSWD